MDQTQSGAAVITKARERSQTGARAVNEHSLPLALAADLDGAFERLVRSYQDRVFGLALRLAGHAQDAEDITQDTFVRAYRALAAYPGARVKGLAVRPWLYRIALNVFRNRVRGGHLHVISLDHVGAERAFGITDTDATVHPERALEQAELRRALGVLVAALPARYRVAVVLRHVQDLGYREIAAILGQPTGTVKANVHRGLRLLQEALVPRRPPAHESERKQRR
jgi:RNA polymerase sigma factor (sigma-70 family)